MILFCLGKRRSHLVRLLSICSPLPPLTTGRQNICELRKKLRCWLRGIDPQASCARLKEREKGVKKKLVWNTPFWVVPVSRNRKVAKKGRTK